MEKIKGVASECKIVTSKDGTKTFLSYKIDGKKISDWDKERIQSVVSGKSMNGQVFEVEAKVNGTYLNASKVTPILQDAAELSSTTPTPISLQETPQVEKDYAKLHMFCIEAVDTAIEGAQVSDALKKELRKDVAALVNTQFIQRARGN